MSNWLLRFTSVFAVLLLTNYAQSRDLGAEPSPMLTFTSQNQSELILEHRVDISGRAERKNSNESSLYIDVTYTEVDTQHPNRLVAEDSIEWAGQEYFIAATHCDLDGDKQAELLVITQAITDNTDVTMYLRAMAYTGPKRYQVQELAQFKPFYSASNNTTHYGLMCQAVDGNPWPDVTLFATRNLEITGALFANISPKFKVSQQKQLPALTFHGDLTKDDGFGVYLQDSSVQLWRKPVGQQVPVVMSVLDSGDVFGRTEVIAGELATIGDQNAKLSTAAVRSLMAVNIFSYHQLLKYLQVAVSVRQQAADNKKDFRHKLNQLHPKLPPQVIDEIVKKLG